MINEKKEQYTTISHFWLQIIIGIMLAVFGYILQQQIEGQKALGEKIDTIKIDIATMRQEIKGEHELNEVRLNNLDNVDKLLRKEIEGKSKK